MKKIIILASMLFSSSVFAISSNMCESIVKNSKKLSVEEKVKAVLQLTESIDISFEHSEEWSLPSETLSKEKGNLYDLAVLRFYALKEMGLNKNHIKINYGYTNGFNIPNVNVQVFDKKTKKYFVLDYLADKPVDSSYSDGFYSAYKYDEDYIWTSEGFAGVASQVKPWQGIMSRVSGSMCDF